MPIEVVREPVGKIGLNRSRIHQNVLVLFQSIKLNGKVPLLF